MIRTILILAFSSIALLGQTPGTRVSTFSGGVVKATMGSVCGNSYNHCAPVPIPINSAGTVTDFSNQVVLSDANLAAYTLSAGHDITFAADSGCTPIKVRQRYWTGTTWAGEVQATRDASTPGQIYICVGKAGLGAIETAGLPYDTGVKHAWDGANNGSVALTDVIGGLTSANYGGTATTGKIGGAITLDGGTGHYAALGTIAECAWSSTCTISTWIWRPNTSTMVEFGFAMHDPSAFMLSWDSDAAHTYIDSHGNWGTASLAGSGWHHALLAMNASSLHFYWDGTEATCSGCVPGEIENEGTLILGGDFLYGARYAGPGAYENIRVFSDQRSAAYAAAEYASGNSPITSVGTWR